MCRKASQKKQLKELPIPTVTELKTVLDEHIHSLLNQQGLPIANCAEENLYELLKHLRKKTHKLQK